jgi:prepilin-type N-terminal cleavage/methylation domain-containing protein
MKQARNTPKGFTFIELIITLTLMSVLFGAVSMVYGNLISKNSLGAKRQEVIQLLRSARAGAVSRFHDSSWGVYFFDDIESRAVMFNGADYLTRDASFDQVILLPKPVTFENINFQGGKEVTFLERSGMTDQPGSLTIKNPEKSYTLTVNKYGITDSSY